MTNPYTAYWNGTAVNTSIVWSWATETRSLLGAPNFGSVEYQIERLAAAHQDQGEWEPVSPTTGTRTVTFLVEGRLDAVPGTRPIEACITAWNRCAKDYRPGTGVLRFKVYDGPSGTEQDYECNGRIRQSFPWVEVREEGGPTTPGIRPWAGRYVYPVVVECPWPWLWEHTPRTVDFTWSAGGSNTSVTVPGSRWAPFRLEVLTATGSGTAFKFLRRADDVCTIFKKDSSLAAGDYCDFYYTNNGLIVHRTSSGAAGGLVPQPNAYGISELRVAAAGEDYKVLQAGVGVDPTTLTVRLTYRGVVDQL